MTGDFLFGRMGVDGVPGQTRRVRRGRGRCLDRQGSAQRPGPQRGGPGGQCGWKDQASHSATPRPSPRPRMGRDRRPAWEPEHVPCTINASQPSSTLEGQVLHHLVQEEHLGPTVVELEDPRQMQVAPETRGGPASCLEPVQELPETPVLERREVSPASASAELEDVPAVASAMELVPELEPHEPSGLGPMAPAAMAPGLVEPDPGLEPAHPCAASTRDVTRKEERNILVFPFCLVAEQLTLAFATLYSRINYFECKAYLRKQSQTGDIERLAPTMHRVLREFDTLVELVTTTCLRTPSMTAQDRAQVVEFWIRVAKECHVLRNFAALRAILLALQSRALGRLERTWGYVSWRSTRMYKNLTRKVKWVTRKRLLKELESILRARQRDRMGPEERKRKGMVPYLGLFLADLPKEKLLEHNEDVATLQDEIMVHKHMAGVYDLERDEHFMSFAQAMEPLDEEQSYSLSCQLEPQGQGAGRKGLLQFFRSHKM
ncbi:ral-GDS-related protein-like [Manis javanica]|uniref:ral-GDS-related protein-like n=3 Tax=Manis javanica TaxID=9974 RepID=UPI003C6D1753